MRIVVVRAAMIERLRQVLKDHFYLPRTVLLLLFINEGPLVLRGHNYLLIADFYVRSLVIEGSLEAIEVFIELKSCVLL